LIGIDITDLGPIKSQSDDWFNHSFTCFLKMLFTNAMLPDGAIKCKLENKYLFQRWKQGLGVFSFDTEPN